MTSKATEEKIVPAKTETGRDSKHAGKVAVAGKIDPDVWDACVLRAFTENRVKTNGGVVELALRFYADSATK